MVEVGGRREGTTHLLLSIESLSKVLLAANADVPHRNWGPRSTARGPQEFHNFESVSGSGKHFFQRSNYKNALRGPTLGLEGNWIL